MPNRRALLQYGGLGLGSALLLPPAIASALRGAPAASAAPPANPHAGHLAGHGRAVPAAAPAATGDPFTSPMPVPSTLRPLASVGDTDFYLLSHGRATVELIPGKPAEVYAYGGSYVGPTIRARAGRRVVIAHRNRLDMATSVHLHGGHVPAASDGHPTDLIEPGATKLYNYPNRQGAATLWYHDHAHHMEHEHIYRGLHGFYLLADEREEALRLPSGKYDIPIMLTDAQFADDGSLIWVPDDFINRQTVLVNGRPKPYLAVAARKYRLRLLDAANLRSFQLSVGGGAELVQIASDGGLLPEPVSTEAIALSPGERAEVVVDFSRFPVGTQIELSDDTAGPLLRFHVTRQAPDASRLPGRLRSLPSLAALPAPTAVREVKLGLDFASGQFRIDGKSFDPARVDAQIALGSTEIWQVTNTDTQLGIPHNLHLHLVQFRVLDRDGQPPAPGEAGLKDTVAVAPGETVRLQATFGDYPGRYVYHCHMVDHSAAGMMAQMEISG